MFNPLDERLSKLELPATDIVEPLNNRLLIVDVPPPFTVNCEIVVDDSVVVARFVIPVTDNDEVTDADPAIN
jgi:hypothetical protein